MGTKRWMAWGCLARFIAKEHCIFALRHSAAFHSCGIAIHGGCMMYNIDIISTFPTILEVDMWVTSICSSGCVKAPDTSLKYFGLSRYYSMVDHFIRSYRPSFTLPGEPRSPHRNPLQGYKRLDVGRWCTPNSRFNYLGLFKFSLRRAESVKGS